MRKLIAAYTKLATFQAAVPVQHQSLDVGRAEEQLCGSDSGVDCKNCYR